MNNSGTVRVRYFEEQFLRTKDFIAEQSYHLTKQRLHVITQHSWGIVSGLTIQQDEDNNLFVAPGIAVDGYGRELILPVRQTIFAGAFNEQATEVLDVWLVYTKQESTEPPSGYAPCDDEGSTPYRIQEKAEVVLRRSDTTFFVDPSRIPERRQPEGVPKEDLTFKPVPKTSDSSEEPWPVFLGQIARQKDGEEVNYLITEDGRPYAGLLGESMEAPSGKARLQIGAEGKEENDCFAVYLEEDTACEKSLPKLAVDNKGNTLLRGEATFHGDLTLDGGSMEFSAGLAGDRARPWQVYRAEIPASRDEPRKSQLRIEMGSADENSEVVIGAWSEDGKFEPCFTIQNDETKTVMVHGDLLVKKEFYPPPAAAVKLATDAQSLAVSALMLGATSAISSQIEEAVEKSDIDGKPKNKIPWLWIFGGVIIGVVLTLIIGTDVLSGLLEQSPLDLASLGWFIGGVIFGAVLINWVKSN